MDKELYIVYRGYTCKVTRKTENYVQIIVDEKHGNKETKQSLLYIKQRLFIYLLTEGFIEDGVELW